MRHINGIAGCQKGSGPKELENDEETCVRIIDTADNMVALRIGTHPDCVRMTPDEAMHLSKLIKEAAVRLSPQENK